MELFQPKDPKYYQRGETKRRSVVKAFTWRTLGTLDTIVISYVLTGQIGIAISIGGIEVFTKMFLYFFHERVWNMIKWGKRRFMVDPEHKKADEGENKSEADADDKGEVKPDAGDEPGAKEKPAEDPK